jgi:undecaprenyl diphosphate synthase
MPKTTQIPKHIAVIMDGNRRWAKEHGLPVLAGHKKVADEILEPLIEHAAKLGISYMTFWAWSTENWGREMGEVQGIMQLFRSVIQKKWQRLHEKGVRIRAIGDVEQFPGDIAGSLKKVIEQTKNNTKITTVFALNYGGRDEITRAINTWHRSHKNDKSITMKQFTNFLDTAGIPDPELIIRTGGEQRLSGFLPWQSEYSELMFPDWYMPEFTPKRLDEVLVEYANRQRRFGK